VREGKYSQFASIIRIEELGALSGTWLAFLLERILQELALIWMFGTAAIAHPDSRETPATREYLIADKNERR
jgi:hypothetical protein